MTDGLDDWHGNHTIVERWHRLDVVPGIGDVCRFATTAVEGTVAKTGRHEDLSRTAGADTWSALHGWSPSPGM
jgi:hypothetical protein